MVRRLTCLLAFAVPLVSCTADPAPTTTTAADATTTVPVTTGEEPAAPGRLVVVDRVGDVVMVDRDGRNRIELATTGAEGLAFAQPIWSPDGSLVSWAQAGPDGFSYVVRDLETGGVTEVATAQYAYYAYWSPESDRLGLLRNGDTGVVLELLDLAEQSVSVVDTDTSYYFSWSPSGDGLVAHAGANRLVSRDRVGDEQSSGETAAGYVAPHWLDGGVLHVDGDRLVIDSDDGTRTDVAEVAGFTTFVANRQGTRVALQSIIPDEAVSVALGAAAVTPPNELVVVDVESGAVAPVTATPAVAFFWSPDGDSLLVMELNDSQDGLATSVWTTGGLQEYVEYAPSPVQLRDLFPFFPQYAQSLSFWSSGSDAFVLVGEIEGETGVWVQQLVEGAPELVSDGVWAAWSP